LSSSIPLPQTACAKEDEEEDDEESSVEDEEELATMIVSNLQR